jgi:hypothetical protein
MTLFLRSLRDALVLHFLNEAQIAALFDDSDLTEGSQLGQRVINLPDMLRLEHPQRSVQSQDRQSRIGCILGRFSCPPSQMLSGSKR